MVIFIVKEYVSAQIGGEFVIGGLFNTVTDEVQSWLVYSKWERYAPSLEIAIADSQTSPPIL